MPSMTVGPSEVRERAAVSWAEITHDESERKRVYEATDGTALAADVESFATGVRAIAVVGTAAVAVIGFAPFIRWFLAYIAG